MPEKAKRKRRSFSSEFKQDAIDLIVKQGYSFKAAAEAVGVEVRTLRDWHEKLAPPPKPGTSGTRISETRTQDTRGQDTRGQDTQGLGVRDELGIKQFSRDTMRLVRRRRALAPVRIGPSHCPQWRRIRSITSPWQRSMKVTIFICPLQHGHSSGSTSYTRLMSMAQVEIEPGLGPSVAEFWSLKNVLRRTRREPSGRR